MRYCSYCGDQPEHGETCSCGHARRSASIWLKRIKKWNAPVVMVLAAMVAVLAAGCSMKPTINLSDYLVIDGVYGEDGNGVVEFALDEERLRNAILELEDKKSSGRNEKTEDISEIENVLDCITVMAVPEDGLSFGDIVTVTATFENKNDYEFSCRFEDGKKYLTVSNLKEREETADVVAELEISQERKAEAAFVEDGDVLFLEENAIKKNKELSFAGSVDALDTIVFRHGENKFDTAYLAINNSSVETYRYNSSSGEYVLSNSYDHNLTIQGETEIDISADHLNRLTVSIKSNSGTFTKSNIAWAGTRGAIEMESVNSTLSDVSLTWSSSDYSHDVWFFGDSYFALAETRWPYYLLQEQDNFLLSGFGGARSQAMYEDFRTALTHGTPKYAVWCLGMNDGDSESSINSSWKEYTELFISDCEAKGIVPILSTTPNTPTKIHVYKNEYVRNCGYRYIDFAAAVGATELGSPWFENMLTDDNVHPDILGGKALAQQVLGDVPEIKLN